MADVWSFNTTIRNPERMENMLRALSEMEGDEFNLAGQRKFFGLQIQKRLYKPTKAKLGEADLINAIYHNDSADDLSKQMVERILEKYRNDPVDASGRGRTTAGILNRFALCVALQSQGKVVVTPLGKKWLHGQIDDEEIFTKFFLKWQYPNQIEPGYDGFNIKPFIGLLTLIHKVNDRWSALGNEPVGLSRKEYEIFVPSMTSVPQIDEYVDSIINFRLEGKGKSGRDLAIFKNDFISRRLATIFPNKDAHKAASDLRDYADSSIRYFRMSGFISLRGNDTHIDIAKDKIEETNSILENINCEAERYDSYADYFDNLNNIESPKLPWLNEKSLSKIDAQLTKILESEGRVVTDIDQEYGVGLDKVDSRKRVMGLQAAINNIRLNKLANLRNQIEPLDECIDKLKAITGSRYETVTTRPSLDLEWFVARALMVINDAINILPSFKMGDDGIPTGFRANKADIECYYSNFGMTVEATLLIGRDQWIAEGQPVMRHLRDFENSCELDAVYCLFIAPFIHRDALNTFWNSNKHGYEGSSQKIIPLTVSQFVNILLIARSKIQKKHMHHQCLKVLLDSLIKEMESHTSSTDWLKSFDRYINEWAASLPHKV